ncbi:hypothetical protein D3C73_1522560 [compost metagenome]
MPPPAPVNPRTRPINTPNTLASSIKHSKSAKEPGTPGIDEDRIELAQFFSSIE